MAPALIGPANEASCRRARPRDGRSVSARAEAREHFGEVLGADMEVLAHPSPEHGCRDVAVATFLLDLVEDEEDYSLLAGEAVADVGEIRQEVVFGHGDGGVVAVAEMGTTLSLLGGE
jgi:hypothetical protein